MPSETRNVGFALASRTVVDHDDGTTLVVPDDWDLVKPGDAALTRRVKAAGPSWTVTEKVGRRTRSYGVYAPAQTIAAVREALEQERQDPAYAASSPRAGSAASASRRPTWRSSATPCGRGSPSTRATPRSRTDSPTR